MSWSTPERERGRRPAPLTMIEALWAVVAFAIGVSLAVVLF